MGAFDPPKGGVRTISQSGSNSYMKDHIKRHISSKWHAFITKRTIMRFRTGLKWGIHISKLLAPAKSRVGRVRGLPVDLAAFPEVLGGTDQEGRIRDGNKGVHSAFVRTLTLT